MVDDVSKLLTHQNGGFRNSNKHVNSGETDKQIINIIYGPKNVLNLRVSPKFAIFSKADDLAASALLAHAADGWEVPTLWKYREMMS